MPRDIEDTLARELRAVAEGLDIPVMPRLPEEHGRPARRRQTFLAAAAVVAVVAGGAGLVAALPDGRDLDPAGPASSLTPSPTSGPSEPVAPIPRSAPTLPHVVDGTLYVDGAAVAGSWWLVRPAGQAWIGWHQDYTWSWGRGPQPVALPYGEDVNPRISPDGRYVAVVRTENGEGILTVLDTRSGRDVEGTPTSIGPVKPEVGAYVTAVTNDLKVVIRRGDGYLTWSQELTADTLSGQMVFDATSAGVMAGDVDSGPTYLAELSERGQLTRLGELPEHDDLVVSPGGTWLAWTPLGTTGGEVSSVPTLQVGTVEGGQPATLTAPDGWSFKVRTWAWEDDAHLISTVTDDRGRERVARCRPLPAECQLTQPD